MTELKELIDFVPQAVSEEWKAIEIAPVRLVDNQFPEVCTEAEADMYSLYVRNKEGEARCIADLPTKEWAEKLVGLITAMVKYRPRKTEFVYILSGYDAVSAYNLDEAAGNPESELSQDTLKEIQKDVYYPGKIKVGSKRSIHLGLKEAFDWVSSMEIPELHYEQIVNFKS